MRASFDKWWLVSVGILTASAREWIVGRGDLVAWAAFSAYSFGFLAVAVAVSYLSYRYIE